MKAISPYLGYVLALVMGGIFIFYFKNGCNRPAIGDNTKDSILFWKTKYGAVASLQKTVEDFGAERQGYLDSIAKLYATKQRYLKEVLQYQIRGHDTVWAQAGTIKVVGLVRDTVNTGCPPEIRGLEASFVDPYYTVDVLINADGTNSRATVTTLDTLTAVWKTVKEGSIFSRKTFLQLDLHSANPYNHFTGMHAYRQPEFPTKRWAIGLTAGYGYGFNVSSPRPFPFIGIGLTYSIIRF